MVSMSSYCLTELHKFYMSKLLLTLLYGTLTWTMLVVSSEAGPYIVSYMHVWSVR